MLIRVAACLTVMLAGVALAQEAGPSADVPLPRPRPAPEAVVPADPPPAREAEAADPEEADPEEDVGEVDAPAASPEAGAEPAVEAEAEADSESSQEPLVPLPRPRPDPDPADAPADEDDAEPGGEGEAAAPVEPEAPPRIYQSACPAVISGAVIARPLSPISEGACGEQSPLEVTAVIANGREIGFSSPAILSCPMATALPEWIAEIDRYAEARENSGIAEVLTGTSYMCRNVNNARAGNLSFHAFANALDVTGFILEDGRRITLPEGWTDPLSPEGRLLRFAHSSACARFTTTLGPEANALHRDHLHVDMGCHGGRCTARLCE